MSWISPRRRLLAFTLAVGAGVASCDIPTSAPKVEQTWLIPLKTDSIPVTELIPAGMTLNAGVFNVVTVADSSVQTLDALCPACVPLNGTTAAKPAFNASLSTVVAFPIAVQEVTLGAAPAAPVVLENNLSFDPIRPNGNTPPYGRVILYLVAAGNDTLAVDSLEGATAPLPPGSQDTVLVPLVPGHVLVPPVNVEARIESPAGSAVLINTSESFVVVSPAVPVPADQTKIVIQNKPFTSASVPLDFTHVDAQVRDGIKGAGVRLVLTNPLPIGGSVALHFKSQGADVFTPLALNLNPGTDSSTAILTAAETQQLIGQVSMVNLDGTVSSIGGGGVTVLPSDQVRIQITLGARILVNP
jgi:hypothetical protein